MRNANAKRVTAVSVALVLALTLSACEVDEPGPDGTTNGDTGFTTTTLFPTTTTLFPTTTQAP